MTKQDAESCAIIWINLSLLRSACSFSDDDAHTNLLMYYGTSDEITFKRKDEGYSSKIDRMNAYKYLAKNICFRVRHGKSQYANASQSS